MSNTKATIEEVLELKKLSETMNDPDLDRAMVIVINCLKQPHVPANKVADVITELSALAAKFGMVKVWYKTFGKADKNEIANNRMKKDVYFTVQDVIYNLIDSLKYHVRAKENRF